jgi:hypothetical protein
MTPCHPAAYAVCAGPSRPAPVVIALEQPAATTRNTTRRAQRQRPCIVTAGTVPRARGRCNASWYLLSHAPVGGLVAHDVWRAITGGNTSCGSRVADRFLGEVRANERGYQCTWHLSATLHHPEVAGTGERCRLPRMNQPATATTVTIIGAGLGGIALVANLGLLGYRLRLHDRDEARIARVRERGGLDVEGLAKGFAPLELVTPQLAPAVDGADVIVVVTGSHFHADVAAAWPACSATASLSYSSRAAPAAPSSCAESCARPAVAPRST